MDLLTKGFSDREISQKLGVTRDAIKHTLDRIAPKIGIQRNRHRRVCLAVAYSNEIFRIGLTR